MNCLEEVFLALCENNTCVLDDQAKDQFGSQLTDNSPGKKMFVPGVGSTITIFCGGFFRDADFYFIQRENRTEILNQGLYMQGRDYLVYVASTTLSSFIRHDLYVKNTKAPRVMRSIELLGARTESRWAANTSFSDILISDRIDHDGNTRKKYYNAIFELFKQLRTSE